MSILRKAVRQSFVAALLACCTFFASAQTPVAPEYQVKAVFIFNFTQFVEWPSSSFTSAQAPFVIGILGEDPFGTYLEEIISGEKVNGHPLVIEHYRNVEEIKACHILFVTLAETNTMQQWLTSLKSQNILLVSDANSFLKQGGMIGLIIKENKMHIRINSETVKKADLIISSKLLRVAEIVSIK